MKSIAVLLTREQEQEVARDIEKHRYVLLREVCYADLSLVGRYLRTSAREVGDSTARLPIKYMLKYTSLEENFNGSQEKNIAQVQAFFKEMGKWDVLDALVEVEELNQHRKKLSSLKSNWYNVRNKFVHSNIPMLLEEAKRFCRQRNENKDEYGEIINPCERKEYFEMVNLGYKGLLRAADKFDPDENVRFYTYAILWIKHYLGRGSEKDIKAGLFGPNLESIYAPVNNNYSDLLKIDTMASTLETETQAQQDEIQEKVRLALQELQLPPKTLEILMLRLGHGLSLREAGTRVGLSYQTVSNIEKSVIPLLKESTLLKKLYEESA